MKTTSKSRLMFLEWLWALRLKERLARPAASRKAAIHLPISLRICAQSDIDGFINNANPLSSGAGIAWHSYNPNHL